LILWGTDEGCELGVIVHFSAVERSGLGGLNECQKLSYEIEAGRQPSTSKLSDCDRNRLRLALSMG
jgi:cold shock CspA family protein